MRARRGVWLVLGVTAAVLALGVVAAWGALAYTGTPRFCASCHIMETRYVSWRRSAHVTGATCIQCHSEPGPWGEFKAHLNGTRYLYVMLTGEKSGAILRAEVASATCEHCHAAAALPERTPRLDVRHALHRGRGIECVTCHAGLVHGTMHPRAAMPSEAVCARCHTRPAVARRAEPEER